MWSYKHTRVFTDYAIVQITRISVYSSIFTPEHIPALVIVLDLCGNALVAEELPGWPVRAQPSSCPMLDKSWLQKVPAAGQSRSSE